MNPQQVKELLESGFTDARVEVAGDGRHFQALVVSPDFEGAPMLKRHRMVYAQLREHIDSEVLHAISLRTLTPEQWAAE
ncbi:MAG: BolA/IbaG family iron-sulfur metabolism protein [Nitrococcus sp.]|nr:BolA/IbaG family iron-sulfur metabolism protein [Nitrococcus sp.]MDN5871073.1 BolA/IbaG family iron-sulfur metabolism protein [Nitrococcus sp.]